MIDIDTNKLIELAIAETQKLLAGGPEEVAKATIGLAQGQFGVSLEQPAKQLVPFMPTWAQRIPRQVIGTGNVHQYKRITGVNFTGKSTAGEGARGNAVTLATDDPTVTPGIISSGVFDVTLEAERAAGSFDDALARATSLALLTGRRNETAHILGGNRTALGACASIAAADVASPASDIGASTYYVNVKPLTAMAVQKAILGRAVILPDGTTKGVAGIDAVVDQTDGYGIEGTEANVILTANHGLKVTWTPKPGAAGYAIFVGTTSGIANLKCQGVVGQCEVVLTHFATAGSSGVTGDNSADTNDFDGVLPLLAASGSGAYVKNIAGQLSAATGNGVPEIDTMLGQCYLQQLGMDDGVLIMGIMDRVNLTRKLGAGSSTSIVRVNVQASDANSFTGAAYVDSYVHPITGRKLRIETDPNLYYGVIAWVPTAVPYVAAEVESPLKMWLNYEWLLLPYAMTAPKREYEARLRGGLACYIPPAFGILHNIHNG